MLSINKYAQEYVDECRSKIARQISAYTDLVSVARDVDRTNEARLDSSTEAFEPLFFNHMVLALDHYFCHRSRTMERKDGNPLNEVRVLCNSLMNNDGIVTADKTIRLDPAKSLLKYQVGDRIKLNEADFSLLSKAFFADITSKYS